MQRVILNALPLVSLLAWTVTSCSDDSAIKSQKKSYSSNSSPNSTSVPDKKPVESIEEIDELSSSKPNSTTGGTQPTSTTDSDGTTPSAGSIATSTTTVSPLPSSSVPSTTSPLSYEMGQALRSRKDGSMSVQIDLIGDGGSSIKSMTLQDPNEGQTQQMPDMCRKGGPTKLKITFINGRSKTKGDKCYFVVSNNAAKVRVDVDMQGDSAGCKPGEDDQFEFSCPSGSIEVM